MLDAVWQSTVIFFFAHYAYANEANIDALSFGFSIAFSMTITSMLHVCIQTSRIDISLLGTILLSLLIFFGFTLIFDATCVGCLTGQSPYYVSYNTFQEGIFWLTNLLTIITAMLPRFIVKCAYNKLKNPLLKTTGRRQVSSRNEETRFWSDLRCICISTCINENDSTKPKGVLRRPVTRKESKSREHFKIATSQMEIHSDREREQSNV